MGIFDLLFGTTSNPNDKKKWEDQEMANMYELGWDEPEDTKYDDESLRREKFYNYEYDYENDKDEF